MNDVVMVTMKDLNTGNEVVRTICALNAYSSGMYAWELGDIESQRARLNEWIIDRANAQHETTLELISWVIVK